ncbi:hypothetical protein PLIP_a0665 [Pseudoalteromonas lipolytica LMEB 39]|nr:hypothetical protein [Pseudoalteromonas lipolytica LMEB 39]
MKEITDNEAEKELLQEINQNEQTKAYDSSKLGKRFRSLIRAANQKQMQIK